MTEQLKLGLRIPGGRKPRPEASRRKPGRRGAFGAETERRAKALMSARGMTVTRAAGSHGVGDLIGVDPHGKVLVVQVKSGVSAPGPTEKARVLADLRRAYPSETTRVELWFWDADRRQWERHREESTNER